MFLVPVPFSVGNAKVGTAQGVEFLGPHILAKQAQQLIQNVSGMEVWPSSIAVLQVVLVNTMYFIKQYGNLTPTRSEEKRKGWHNVFFFNVLLLLGVCCGIPERVPACITGHVPNHQLTSVANHPNVTATTICDGTAQGAHQEL